MEKAETCVLCGEIIPEGRQVCPSCWAKNMPDRPYIASRRKRNAREITEDLLLMLGGANPTMKGFRYLATSVTIAIEQPEKFGKMYDVFYPAVARECAESVSSLEKAIRTLIKAVYDNGDMDAIFSVLGNIAKKSNGLPATGAVIATLVLKVRRELNDGNV